MQSEQPHTQGPASEEELYKAIGVLAAGAAVSPPLFLKDLKADIRKTPHPRRALTNLHRFLVAGFSSALIRDLQEHEVLRQILVELLSQSQFLADILVRNPELFRWLTSSNVLKLTKTVDQYDAEAAASTGLFQRSEKILDSLKRFQRRELLRIGARQILREADVTTTSEELSSLADSIIAAVVELAYRSTESAMPDMRQRDLAVVGLGKLGGGELNFSSDIDLMFVYDKDGPLQGSPGRISTLHEYYSRISEFIVRRLSEHTPEGHLYRVDMRLRPDGSVGPLAMSRGAFMSYYESRGELWERQMLIKARVIAGDRETGAQWMRDLLPFVYPRTLRMSPLEEIAQIKSRIEANLGDEANIKLGSGGIRDIEFSVQALQLLNGGSDENLRERGTLKALRALTESGHLQDREGRALEDAYRLLRTIEDRLQLLHGLQQHALPQSPEELRVLARQLGFSSEDGLSRKLFTHQSAVRKVFRSVFEPSRAGKGRASSKETSVTRGALRRTKFAYPVKAGEDIETLIREVPELGDPHRLSTCLRFMQKQGAPDRCLSRLLAMASSTSMKRTLRQAVLNDRVLDLVLLVCSRSSRYTDLLLREPLLFEMLVGRPEDMLTEGLGWNFLKESDLVKYRMYNEFKAALRYLSGESSVRAFTRELSTIADDVVNEGFRQALVELPAARRIPIALLGLGKLGGMEISIGSDLDVVLVYEGVRGEGSARIVNSVGRKIRECLDKVYALDFRLRPEGKNAPLATEWAYYQEYLQGRASFWERQSLVKARFVAGTAEFGAKVSGHLRRFAFGVPLPRDWKKELMGMRRRIAEERANRNDSANLKTANGGLVDLEFVLQASQLRFAGSDPDLEESNSFGAVEALIGKGYLKSGDVRALRKNLDYLRRLETSIRMNSDSTDFVLPKEKERLQVIAAAMGARTSKELLADVRRVQKSNRQIYLHGMKTLPS